MKLARIENWCVVDTDSDPYTPPELRVKRLHGNVYGHPGFEDGTEVTTTHIMSYDYPARRVTTHSREYALGKIEGGYLEYLRANPPKTFNPEDFAITQPEPRDE